MILLDFNQIIISLSINEEKKNTDESIRDMSVMNSFITYILSIKKRYSDKYGNVVICCDSKNFWRKEVFPYYKHSRKKDRENSNIDWKVIFDTIRTVKKDLVDWFPYRLLELDTVEADDIIAILTKEYHDRENILILSSDKDFKQLQIYKGVSQYSYNTGKFIKTTDPKKYLREHILRGDRSDGIPNVLSPDDVFLSDYRQTPLRKNKLIEWLDLSKNPYELLDDDLVDAYKRNEKLIDFNFIPEVISESILNDFVKMPGGNNNTMMEYFTKNKMIMLYSEMNNLKEDVNETYTRSVF